MKKLLLNFLYKIRRILSFTLPLESLNALYELELRKESRGTHEHIAEISSKLYQLTLANEIYRRQVEHPNPFCKYGRFGFSQSDEDGITIEVVNRLNIEHGKFCEFGVGDGTENNTLILLAMGWTGAWVGGEDLKLNLSQTSKLTFQQEWVTKENIHSLYNQCTNSNEQLDIVSLDLDGNDFYLIEELLTKGVSPKIFIVEYNAKFPPQVKFKIPYNPEHNWQNDDFFGASLLTFVELFKSYGYSLICCNAASGANAYFVRDEFMHKFPEVPNNINDIYSEPFYLLRQQKMHPTSIKTLQTLLSEA